MLCKWQWPLPHPPNLTFKQVRKEYEEKRNLNTSPMYSYMTQEFNLFYLCQDEDSLIQFPNKRRKKLELLNMSLRNAREHCLANLNAQTERLFIICAAKQPDEKIVFNNLTDLRAILKIAEDAHYEYLGHFC